MSTEAWRPLDEREAGAAAPEPVLLDGVPEHLEQPLRRWLHGFFDLGGHAQRVGLRLRVPTAGQWGIRDTLVNTDVDQLLRVVDAALFWQPNGMAWAELPEGQSLTYEQTREWRQNFADPVVALTLMLTDAGSAWAPAGGGRRLQRRVDATVHQAHAAATTAASGSGRPEAARDLADAWAKVYGTHPDPSEAYRLAIRAVEDVAIPLTIPQDKLATLGKVRAYLTNAGAKWRLSMTSDVEPLVAMISLLWTGQTDRHAGQVDLTRVDQKASEQAVHLATTLVQWFAAGHVQRLP